MELDLNLLACIQIPNLKPKFLNNLSDSAPLYRITIVQPSVFFGLKESLSTS